MNRIYLFRGKRIDNKEWVFGNLLQRKDSIGSLSLIEFQLDNDESFEVHTHQVYPESVGQFTGLLDVSGKRIFNGDLLSHQNRLYEVARNFNGYYLQRYKLWNGEFKPAFQYALSLITYPLGDRGEDGGVVKCAEVVGNILDNPELIKKQQL